MNIISYSRYEIKDVKENKESTIQKKVDNLALLCRTPSPEKIKYSLMHRNGALLNMPFNKTSYAQFLQKTTNAKSCIYPCKQSPKYSSRKKKSKYLCKQSDASYLSTGGNREEIVNGYILQRTSDKVHVTLTDNFWNDDNSLQNKYIKNIPVVKKPTSSNREHLPHFMEIKRKEHAIVASRLSGNSSGRLQKQDSKYNKLPMICQ